MFLGMLLSVLAKLLQIFIEVQELPVTRLQRKVFLVYATARFIPHTESGLINVNHIQNLRISQVLNTLKMAI